MVTREFAAHTANFCAGFYNESDIKFTDTDDIYYEDDASVSVLKGWFEVVDNNFYSDMYMKSIESAEIKKDLTSAINSLAIDENVSILDGDIFTVNINGIDYLYEVKSVSMGNNGKIIAEVKDDFYDYR